MNNYGMILGMLDQFPSYFTDEIGFYPLIQKIIDDYLQPITQMLFPEDYGDSLDDHHCFLVRYKAGEDVKLALHVDDSEVTLNVCLGKEFKGIEATKATTKIQVVT